MVLLSAFVHRDSVPKNMGLKSKFLLILFFVGGLSETSKYFTCKSGKKIEKILKCDFMTDCDDGSDESFDTCSGGESCSEGKFSCLDIRECVSTKYLCDGFDDCSDGTDEIPETCSTVATTYPPCPASEFSCSNGTRCLPRKYVCDGHTDCADDADEDFEMCCNSKLDIGSQTYPCSTSSASTPTTTNLPEIPKSTPTTSTTLNLPNVPKKCLKKPCNKKCKSFWNILPQILDKKVKSKMVRKCSKKKVPKRCLKCKVLLLNLGLSATETKPRGKGKRKRCGKKRNRKGCKVAGNPTLP